ncbi:hypothetical protein CRG98_011223 [Punica granatum]|uniref:Protein-lysine N-methyltransferase CRG98_011223 n=1 Tax=Punica granatum TaxID=22663 RepID=A0A2I0KKU7_PUNGR|nr:hypothetical protein CRG98_011223 [Punica granatum]
MAGFRLPPEDSELPQANRPALAPSDLVSDDDRSIAADSWSIKSEYGSTLDDDQRHADAADALLSSGNFRTAASDYSSDKEVPDADGVGSLLGLQSYWDAAYADELANFHEHGHAGEVWFGGDVMETLVCWTKSLCLELSQGHLPTDVNDIKEEPQDDKYLPSWSVLDLGTGNGLLLQELAKHGLCTFPQVDDVLETKLDQQFKLVMDKGTLDAIGLHPDGTIKRIMYWDSVSKLVAPGGLLVITSCNSTKDEIVQEVDEYNQRGGGASIEAEAPKDPEAAREPIFRYLNHVRSYPTFMFGGSVGSRVATVAFLRN